MTKASINTTKEVINTAINTRLYYRIGDVSKLSGIKPHVLRYWESEFPFLAPEKSVSGQRVYRKKHIQAALLIKDLLYRERYSIEGAKKRIHEMKKKGEFKELRFDSLVQSNQVSPTPQDIMQKDQRIKTLLQEISQLADDLV
ncbi:MAG: MerR family transcriptional regulator [Bdellovibrio sp.]|nr:MerR family transcriptional regulator [Bdellovibrio sp.]